MGKSPYTLDEKKIEAWIKEGRGQGIGKDRKPWLTVQDVASWGNCTRVTGWKTGREHHLLSDLELMFFYLLEFCPFVIDIWEQFALLDRDYAREIARALGYAYPTDRKTKVAIVMTTDFVIKVRCQNGEEKLIARTVKPKAHLTKRTIEKFQIEQITLSEAYRIEDWGIWTKDELPEAFADNVKWIYAHRHADHLEMHPDQIQEIAIELSQRVIETKRPLRLLTSEYDDHKKLAFGTSIGVVKHLEGIPYLGPKKSRKISRLPVGRQLVSCHSRHHEVAPDYSWKSSAG